MRQDRADSATPPQGTPVLRPVPLRGYALAISALWTMLLAASLLWNLQQDQRTLLGLAAAQARVAIEKDVIYRRWNAASGGVYALRSPDTPPNPHLQLPERDLTTPGGKELTLVNPAYMTRQVHELGFKSMGMRGHITSLKPLRPDNTPDPWEAAALRSFAEGKREATSVEEVDGKPYLRLMRPLMYEQSCQGCHQTQGYKVGDVRGGISAAVPLEPLYALTEREVALAWGSHGVIWLLGLAGIWAAARGIGRRQAERDRAQREREATLLDLLNAQKEVKILTGLLPICASCKRIRDESGYWQGLEQYIHGHSQADFTHSICPECYRRLYPELGPPPGDA